MSEIPPGVRVHVQSLARIVNATANDLPSFGSRRDLGYSHVEFDGLQYHLIRVDLPP